MQHKKPNSHKILERFLLKEKPRKLVNINSNNHIIEESLDNYLKKFKGIRIIKNNENINILKDNLLNMLDSLIKKKNIIDSLKFYNLKLQFYLEYFIKDLLSDKKVKIDKDLKLKLEKINSILERREIIDIDYDLRVEMHTEENIISIYFEIKNKERKRRIDFIIRNTSPQKDEKILDIGCGTGSIAYHCAKMGARCYAIDYSIRSLELGKKLIKKYDLENKVNFIQWEVDNPLPFKDNYFNKIVVADFVEHIYDNQKEKLISEVLRVIKTDGIIIIFTPNKIREDIGYLKRKILRIFKKDIPETRLHFGLINKFKFNKILNNYKKYIKNYKTLFFDPGRPILYKIPIIKEILSLNILWEIQKRDNLNYDN